MYLRRARVLFVATGDAVLAQRAVALAGRLGAEWVEARAAPSAEADALAWADLVVELGAAGELPPLPSGTRRVHWALDAAGGNEARTLEARVRGMIGGMRLLARGRPPRA